MPVVVENVRRRTSIFLLVVVIVWDILVVLLVVALEVYEKRHVWAVGLAAFRISVNP